MEGPQLQGRRLKGAGGMGALVEEVCQTPKQSEGKELAPSQGPLSFAKERTKILALPRNTGL